MQTALQPRNDFQHESLDDHSGFQSRGAETPSENLFPSVGSSVTLAPSAQDISNSAPSVPSVVNSPSESAPLRIDHLLTGQTRLIAVQRAREMRAAHETWEKISATLNVPIGTLCRWIQKFESAQSAKSAVAVASADLAPTHTRAGRPRKPNFAHAQIDNDKFAIAANYLISNRNENAGSVQEAVRMARRKGQLSPEIESEIARRELNGLPLLPESLHQEVTAAPVVVHQFRNPTDANLDYLNAPGTMMWVKDELTGGQKVFIRAGDVLEADDATINFPICIPWQIGCCKVSDRWGVKVGRFQWLVAIDAASRFIPGFSYTARPRGSYRAEDIVSLLLTLFRAHGVWRRCRFERGVFESKLVTSLLANLGIVHWPVYSPHNKPFIEGLFNCLWTKLSDLPGQVGRFQGEMEAGNALLTKCLSGSTDPRRHFPMIHDALAAMQQAIAEKNETRIKSPNYGTWIPRDRWESQRGEGRTGVSPVAEGVSPSAFRPFDTSSEFLFSPWIGEWIVAGAQVGGSVRIMDGFSVRYDFGAPFLAEFDGCSIKAYFDPSAAGDSCVATIVLAQDVRNRHRGEVLGVAPQINEVARYARNVLGYGLDTDLGVQHRKQTAAAMRREVRSVLPNGRPTVASSETRDGLGNNLKVETSAVEKSASGNRRSQIINHQSSISQDSVAAIRAAKSRQQAALIRQLEEQAENDF